MSSNTFWLDTQQKGPDLVVRSVPKLVHDTIRDEATALHLTQAAYLRRLFYMLILARENPNTTTYALLREAGLIEEGLDKSA